MKKSTNYKIKPFEYKKTKLCPICNSKLKIEYFKDIDYVKNKKKICKSKDHIYLINNEYSDNYDVFFLERVGLNKTVIDSSYEYDFIYYCDKRIFFNYNIPTESNIGSARTIFDLSDNEDLAYKIKEAILNQNENFLKKVLMLL